MEHSIQRKTVMLLAFHSNYVGTIKKVRINLSAQLSWPGSCIFIVFPIIR